MNVRAAQTGAVQGDKGVTSAKPGEAGLSKSQLTTPDEERNEGVQSGTSNEHRRQQRSNVPVSTGGVGGSAGEQASAVRRSLSLYEVAVLYDPGLEIDLEKATSKVEKIITEAGGKISNSDNWGKRKLAYPIKKNEFAIYVFYTVEAPAEAVSGIEQTLNITDEVIRFLITKPDLKAKAKAEALAKERAAKAAERADGAEEQESEEE